MNSAGIKRCLIYTRVATSNQPPDDTSLDAQRESLERMAATMGVPVVAYFAEVASGAAGKSARRPREVERLLRAVRPGDVVAVSRLDRLSRDPETAIRDVRRILSNGGSVVSGAEGEFDSSPAAEFKLSILACVARKG